VRILSHYFIARFLGLFATALIATLILLATVELILNFDDLSSLPSTSGSSSSSSSSSSLPSSIPDAASSTNVTNQAYSGSRDSKHEADRSAVFGVVQYLWLRLTSYYLSDLLPIASFAAAFLTFAWAGRAMELVAIQAGGIRLVRVVIPILGVALILSLASAILHETVILRADQIWNTRFRGQDDAIDFGRQAFWHRKGRTITNITKADAATRTLFGVEIFERGSDGTIIRVVRTDRVRIDNDGVWQIADARVWTFDPVHPSNPPTFSEDVEIALDLDLMRGDALLGAEPSLLPLPELARYRDAQQEISPSNQRRLTTRFHERLSQPWLVLLFAFLALPFGLSIDQTGRLVRPALGAAGALGLFFLLRSAGTTLAQQELLPVGIAPWLSIGLFTFATALSLRRRSL
jgi:lipopolysaccharide export LptBFGC system permease protein LptF